MRRALLAAGVVLALAWIAVVTVAVASRPPAGEADPAALAAAFRQALADRDERAVERLLYKPPDGTSKRLLRGCRQDPAPCLALPIGEHHGRWYVDPWAPVPAGPG